MNRYLNHSDTRNLQSGQMKSPQTIACALPKGLTKSNLYHFSNRLNQRIKIPEIREICNAFVSHTGLVLHNCVLTKGCAFNIRGHEDVNYHFPFWRQTIEEYAVCRWGKSLESVHLKGPQHYLLIHSKWFNYAFWTNCYLSRLIEAESQGYFQHCILIVPETWQKISYVWESLKAFDIKMEIIPDGVHLFIDHLVMPETRQYTANFYPPHIQEVRNRLAPIASQYAKANEKSKRRIYLSRENRGVRCVENEEEVMNAIGPLGFEKVIFEHLNFWQQVALMQQTHCFVSLHGAGLGNLMFMRPKSFVIELINEVYAEKEYSFPFWRMANAAGVTYIAQFCSINKPQGLLLAYGKNNNTNELDFLVNQNVTVDIPKLLDNIRLVTG